MKKKLAAIAAAGTVLANSAMAAVPTEVTTALNDGKTDALAVAGLSLVIVIGVAVVKYMRKGV